MTKRIFHSICIAAVSVLAAAVVLFLCVLYNYFSETQFSQLKMQTDMAAQGVLIAGKDYFKDLDTQKYRVTWVDEDGTVLYDSRSDTADMENHMEREEIRSAFETGEGESKRYSSTLMERSLYYAKRLNDGTVLRLSISQNSVLALLLGMLYPICIIIIIVLILSVVLARRLAKSIVNPLNTLNLDRPLENEGYDELSPLLRRIDSQQNELKYQSDRLQRKKNELDTVIDSMNEGIILLNSRNQILSINHTASRLLGAASDPVDESIYEVCRNLALWDLLSEAQSGIRSEKIIDFADSFYQVDASPIHSKDRVAGIALLFFDVTEKEKSEQMLREFTANVSHELKTPLHSIMGYAELMAKGIAKPEDYAMFAEKIHTETKRLVQLVEDIINLSHLDEGASDMQRERVNLYILAQNAVKSLEPEAESAGVELSLKGDDAYLTGVPRLMQSIVYNLCDNAIKYNRRGGKAEVEITDGAAEAVLSVKDTGIGILPEHQNRIFERFYRVDKSHSKAVGGTGLGLSIVKNAAKIHNAKIELSSVMGEGTTITVKFPKDKI